jgi:DHA1 family tetracycline resistance protein-like MFS transporter
MKIRRNAAMGFIFVTLLIDVIGFGIIIPVIPKLIEQLISGDLSKSSVYGGWLMFAYAFMQFLFAPVLGGLSDRFGRRPVLLIALLGLGLDYIFHAFAPSIVWLFVGRIIAGIGGASFTTASAYIADISTPEKRAQNFGLIGVAFGLGFIIGPVIGGIASHWGVRVPFYVAAAFTLLNFLYGYFFVPESLPKRLRRRFEWKRANPLGTLKQIKKYPVLAGLVTSLVLIYIAAHSVHSTWTYYTMLKFDWNATWVGYSLGFVGLLIAIVQGGLIRIVIPKLGQERSVFVGLLLYSIGMCLFAFATKGWMMFAFLVPYALGGIAGPALQGIISAQVHPSEQGELQGALTSLMSVTSIVGPPIMNSMFTYFTNTGTPLYFPGAPFVAGTILLVGSIIFALNPLSNLRLKTKAETTQNVIQQQKQVEKMDA